MYVKNAVNLRQGSGTEYAKVWEAIQKTQDQLNSGEIDRVYD